MQAHTLKLLHTLRERIPDLALRTTFISGFPGACLPAHASHIAAQLPASCACTPCGQSHAVAGPVGNAPVWRCCSTLMSPHMHVHFTGETEEQHRELVDFCASFKFERMGCFQYSAEDGTPAAELPEQVGQAWCRGQAAGCSDCEVEGRRQHRPAYVCPLPRWEEACFEWRQCGGRVEVAMAAAREEN